MWVRDDRGFAAPTLPIYVDLMSDWRTKFNISVNLPEMTIWRFKLKLSITGHITVAGSPNAADGVIVGSYVATISEATAVSAASDFYGEHFLIFDHMYSNKSLSQSADNVAITTTTAQTLYQEYDIKAHRRFEKLDDSFILELANAGQFSTDSFSLTLIALLKLPT